MSWKALRKHLVLSFPLLPTLSTPHPLTPHSIRKEAVNQKWLAKDRKAGNSRTMIQTHLWTWIPTFFPLYHCAWSFIQWKPHVKINIPPNGRLGILSNTRKRGKANPYSKKPGKKSPTTGNQDSLVPYVSTHQRVWGWRWQLVAVGF